PPRRRNFCCSTSSGSGSWKRPSCEPRQRRVAARTFFVPAGRSPGLARPVYPPNVGCRVRNRGGRERPLKYAVLGAAGQLGRDLCPRLPGEVTALTREQADLTCPDTLRAALDAVRPDVVVNCAAYNFVDRAEAEPEAAFAVNGWGVRQLALACRDRDCLLVHFSTDYVF